MLHKVNETFAPIQTNVTWASTAPVSWWQQLTICLLDPDSPVAWGFQWRKEFTSKRMWRQADWLDKVLYLTPTCFPGLLSFSVQSWTLLYLKNLCIANQSWRPKVQRPSRRQERRRPTSHSSFWMPTDPREWLGLFWRASESWLAAFYESNFLKTVPLKWFKLNGISWFMG